MNAVSLGTLDRTHLWRRVKARLFVLDAPLMLILGLLMALSCATMYSSAIDFPGRFEGHLRNFAFAFVVLFVVANLKPQTLMRWAVPLYIVGVTLLVAVAMAGDVRKGARRWLDLGVTSIQPSELLKIGLPLMLEEFAAAGQPVDAREDSPRPEVVRGQTAVCRQYCLLCDMSRFRRRLYGAP